MSLLFMDGFDHYATDSSAEVVRVWDGYDSSSYFVAKTTYLRRSGVGKSVYIYGTYGGWKTIPGAATIIVGVAFVVPSSLGSPATVGIVSFNYSTTVHTFIQFLENGSIRACRASTSNVLGTSAAGVVKIGTWQYLEVKVTISDTVGVVVVKVDGVPVLNLTGQDTRNASTAEVSRIALSAGMEATSIYMDDVYILNTSGSAPYNDFLGPVFIDTLYPDADGNYEQWDRSTGSDSYALVDDPGDMDDDTTYVYTTVHKEKDTFSMNSCPTDGAAGNPLAVNLKVIARKDAASPALKIRPMARLGSTDYIDSEHQNLAEGYLGKWKIWELNPADSQAWETTDIDNGEFGFEMLRSTTTV